MKQAGAQTSYNTHQADDDDDFDGSGTHGTLAIEVETVTQYMRIAHRPFKPTLAGSLATLALLPVLINLGFWQLRRADEKRTIIEQFSGGAVTTQLLTADNAKTLPLLQHITTDGRFDTQRQVLLDNMPASKDAAGFSKPGYRVLTPLVSDGQVVLVDRGWVPLGRTRDELPEIQVEDRARTVRGRLADLPRAGIRLQGAPTKDSWPRVLNFPTLPELQTLYGTKLLPRIVLLDETEPDGFRRDWSARYSVTEFGPEKHIGYAVQWFGLAIALVVIYIVVGFKQAATASGESDERQ
jgi:surfeit locus 1 family protein